jgi:predicted nucleic acid-binding protein
VDANVFVSYLTGRQEKQYDVAQALLREAEDGTSDLSVQDRNV